jgi:cytochrome P450
LAITSQPDLENPGLDDLAPICRNFHVLPIPWVTASDISSAVLFLASDEARYITGVPLPVDAGSCLKCPVPQPFSQGCTMTTVSDGRTESAVYYDPYDAGIVAQPYPVYARLREEAALLQRGVRLLGAVPALRRGEVLANWQTFSNSRRDILELVQSEFDMPPGVMTFEDPPMHTMLRGLMGRVFTLRRMATIEDQIRQYCVRCLDPLVGSDGFDVVAELAAMMPMRVIGTLLGIPEADQTGFPRRQRCQPPNQAGAPMKVANADRIADGRMYADYVEWRSNNPSDDLMTALLDVEFEDEHGVTRKLTRKESALHPGGGRRRQ